MHACTCKYQLSRALLLLLPLLSAKNILVTTPWTGGHFSYPLNIATSLSSSHDVTFLALQHDPNIPLPPNLTYLAGNVSQELIGLEDLNEIALRTGALNCPSERLISQSITGNKATLEAFQKQIKLRFDYFFGDEFNKLMENKKFDLMIVEETIFHPVALIARRLNIPLITAISVVDQQRAKHEQNLPALLTSEPSQFLNLHSANPPTFTERFSFFLEILTFIAKLVPGVAASMEEHLKREGLSGLTDLDNMTQLYLVNDHPALSFPNLKAPNSLDLAGIGFTAPTEGLSGEVRQFVESARAVGKKIVLVSFGTLAFSSDHYELMFGDGLLRKLNKIPNIAFIVRSDKKYPTLPNILSQPWLPKQALLAHPGMVLFASSCGNNAKIESVLHRVPLLCVPLFTDQYFNSLLVLRNGFGEMMSREHWSRDKFVELVQDMVQGRERYEKRLAAASRVVLREPGSPGEKLEFYLTRLVEEGNLAYLKNDVIMKQSAVEIYNVDILAIFVLISGVLLIVISFIALKFGKIVYKKVQAKNAKTETDRDKPSRKKE